MNAASLLGLIAPLLSPQAGEAPAWDKIVAALEQRARGADLPDRVRAVREMATTKDSRAFEPLARSYEWAHDLNAGSKESLDSQKKQLSSLRDQQSQKIKERDAILLKKKPSQSELSRLQDLGAEIGSLDKSIQASKQNLEKMKAEYANLAEIENACREGFVELLRGAAPGLFEKYRKAFASAVNFPGVVRQGSLYVQCLVASGRKEGYASLDELLKNALGSEALFIEAAKGMAALGGKEAIASLIQYLGFPNASVRKAAHEALKASTGQSLPQDKSAWEKWQKSSQG